MQHDFKIAQIDKSHTSPFVVTVTAGA